MVGNQKDSGLGHFFRRIAFRKGRKVAITATARKLAVIIYNMITKRQPYRPEGLQDYQAHLRTQKIKQIQRTIKKLAIQEKEIIFTE